jgi:uncharacterized protein YodC (DUF2158 family)
MTQFNKGDIVVLKSGGPDMTVQHVEGAVDDFAAVITCRWFDQKGSLQTAGFDPETIKKTD